MTDLLDKFIENAPPLQYNVLVVDDEEDVRAVTKLCLKSMKYKGTPVKVTEAASKAEAIELLKNNYGHSYVCAIVDVVMESDHAGLELVTHIRETLGNNSMSIFLRTGQPGQAPEREVMEKLGIDGYVLKTELTDDKLYTMTLASIKSTLRAWPYENAIGQLGLFRFGTYEKEAFMKQVDLAYSLADKLADKTSFASGHYFYCLGKTYSSGTGKMIDDATREQHLALPPMDTSGPCEYRCYKTTHSVYSKVSGCCWVGNVIEFTPEWISTWMTFFQIFDHFIMGTKALN